MGCRFLANHANIVAYITAPEPRRHPRFTYREVKDFLEALALPDPEEPPPIMSAFPEWITQVKEAAMNGLGVLRTLPQSTKVNDKPPPGIEPADADRALSKLKPLLSDYDFFGLVLGKAREDSELHKFAEYAAVSSGHHALILMPKYLGSEPLNVLDPFPAVALLAQQARQWPGVLFWSRSGVAAFAPLRDVNELYSKLQQASDNPQTLESILATFHAKRVVGRAILHLSDVHFGTDAALENVAYLSAHLQSISKNVGRVVITGDLFDSPKRGPAIAFRNFRATLSQQRKGEEVIVIPGNHDQKWLGNVGSPLGQMANLEWTSLFVDDQMKSVFFCFDSSREAELARGRITVQQMKDVAIEFETKSLVKPEIRDYLRVALIHHHPYSFETAKETKVARALEKFGITDEYFLRMDDAEGFLKWCRARGIGLILHGHKHIARYVKGRVELPGSRHHSLVAVGCGTSLGAGGKPLSYNLINWDGASKSWSVSFYADPGDGSGFNPEFVSIHSS